MSVTLASTNGPSSQLCAAAGKFNFARMASAAPNPSLFRFLFEPIRGLPLVGCAVAVWLAGASYCNGYQRLLSSEEPGPWSGSLIWSAVAVVPWFALFEWSKEPRGAEATRRPVLLAGLVLAIAGLSIGL